MWGTTVRSVLADYDRQLDALATTFESVPMLTDDELAMLRRARNAEHVEAARAHGIAPIETRAGLDSARAASDSVRVVGTTDRYVVWDGEHSDPLLTPSAAASLDSIASRFGSTLDTLGLPRYRFTVSSVLRSAEDQADLRGVNVNAASGRSSHEFGTTYDITYRRFSPQPVSAPPFVSDEVPTFLRRTVESALVSKRDAAYEQFAADYPSRLDALLGRVLIGLEDDDVLLTVRERGQPVYHTTVASSSW
ncbi:MAG: hypothetical protein Rubg2KO_05930 [Rubricoccaceae bacterium]